MDRGLGPVEVLVIAFPGNQFNGEILPELERLVESGTVAIVDGLVVRKDVDGEVSFVELSEEGVEPSVARLAGLLTQLESLISDDDVGELADELEPDSSAAVVVFEHRWAKPLRDAIVSSGGVLVDDIHVPGGVIDELLDELEALD